MAGLDAQERSLDGILEGVTMFDIEKFLTETVVDVNATDIRFQDARTGEVYTRTIFRPGKCVTYPVLAKELAHYGYTLLWINDEPSNVPGKMNWSDVFGQFVQQEGVE
jgi:hypothetical protein